MRIHTKSSSHLEDDRRLVFATPPSQPHEFRILSAAINVCFGGIGSIYLSSKAPYEGLLEIPKRTKIIGFILSLIPTESTPSDWLIKLLEFRQSLPVSIPLMVGWRLYPAKREAP